MEAVVGLRVLVVDGEDLVSMSVEDCLDELDCTVAEVAARLEDAAAQARTLALDVVVLDVNLAGQMSYPVAEVLRARGIPMVFTTGYGSGVLSTELHGVPMLSMPFQCEQLAEALRIARDG